jgi:hypothetical protein
MRKGHRVRSSSAFVLPLKRRNSGTSWNFKNLGHLPSSPKSGRYLILQNKL